MMIHTEYFKATDLKALLDCLRSNKKRAVLIAGGTNLIPRMRGGEAAPELLVDISEVPDMIGIRETSDSMVIGAATTIADVAAHPGIADHCAILASAAGLLGNPLTRNRATIGGNLANASPGADTAPPLLALEARVSISGAGGRTREVPVAEFFTGYMSTDLNEGDVLTHITVPKCGKAAAGGHTKLGLRKAASVSVASLALVLEKEKDVVKKIRIAFGSVAPRPIRAYRLEKEIEGKPIDEALLADAEPILQEEISPISDIRGTESYRRHITASIFRRNVLDAWTQEKGQ